MARIITQLYEHTSRALLEAALATRELGYADESGNQCLSFRTNAGSFRRFPSLDRLDDNAAAISSGAALIGFFPPAGMSATTVQAALEELASAGTGGTLTGAGTAGALALWSSGTVLGDAILTQAFNTIRFNGDAVANLYRIGPSALGSDASFTIVGDIETLGELVVGTNISAAGNIAGNVLQSLGGGAEILGVFHAYNDSVFGNQFDIDNAAIDGIGVVDVQGSFIKNNSNVRAFYGLRVKPTLNTGGSNTSTTVYLLDLDTVNLGVTGVTTRLLRASYGGAQRLLLTSGGQLQVSGGGGLDVEGDSQLDGDVWTRHILTVGSDLSEASPAPNMGSHNVYSIYTKNNSTTLRHSLVRVLPTLNTGGSNANHTLDVLLVDTINTATTGLTVNLLRALYGGSERMLLTSSGVMSLSGGGSTALHLYGLGSPGSLNTESLAIGHNGTNAYIISGQAGSGVARPIYIGLGGTFHHSLLANGNISFWNTVDDHGGGVGVLRMHNATTAPTTNPASGFLMYAEAGAARVRGSSGTVTTFGPAHPHCPACGADFMTEHQNAKYGYLAVCLRCLADELGSRPWILRK